MHNGRRIAASLALLLLTACTGGDDGFVQPTAEEMAKLESVVEAVDWSKAEARTIVLDEFEFAPSEMTFTKDQPYELTLASEGATTHNFVAPGFFDAIAVQGLIFADGEVKMPVLESISLPPGETKTLVFVPLKAGEFPLVCDELLHEIFGMTGTLRIE